MRDKVFVGAASGPMRQIPTLPYQPQTTYSGTSLFWPARMARIQPHRHLLTLWLTSLALVFAALMPMPGQTAGASVTWTQMCTARGYVQVAVEQPADTGGSQHSSNPCLWCSLHCSQAQLPGNTFDLALFVAPRLGITGARTTFLPHRRTWPAALSRAPPRQA